MGLTGGRSVFCRVIMSVFSLGILAMGGAANAASGKDLARRWGLGVANIGPEQTPTLSVDWHVTRASAFEFNLGINTTQGNNLLELTSRMQRHIFIEDHMFYDLYLGAGLSSQQLSGSSATGYVLEAGTSAKFFFAGLPNLGLGLGGGFRLESIGGVRFRTLVSAGAHYYF